MHNGYTNFYLIRRKADIVFSQFTCRRHYTILYTKIYERDARPLPPNRNYEGLNIMIEFDLLKSLEENLQVMRELSMPVIICRTSFEVIAANSAAQQTYPGLLVKGGIKTLLEEHGTAKLAEELERNGVVAISDMVALEDIKLVLMPLRQNGELIAISLMFDRSTAVSGQRELRYKAKAADTLSGGLRGAVDGMFRSLDELVQRGDLLGMDWISKYANSISAQGYQVLRLASNVTEYVRLQNGEIIIQPAVVNLTAWMEELREIVVGIGRSIGVPIHLMIPHEDSMIMADLLHFEIAFFNILHNAIYYTKPGNEVFIAQRQVEGGTEITIQDSGLGISEELLRHVTEPYFSYSYGRTTGGSGLGLTLAKRVIEAQRGRLNITSESGEGTRVTIYMPERDFAAPLIFAQNERGYQNVRDRFSMMYIGLAGVTQSPYIE